MRSTPDTLARARRVAAAAAYLGLARHLPWSPRPGGLASRRLRAFLGRWMLDYCGTGVNIEHGAWFGSGKGVRLGDRADIGMDALVIGPIDIGADVLMGPRCILLASSHTTSRVDLPINQQGFDQDRVIVVEDDVWIGAGSIILPGVHIGRGSIIGAGAVVSRDVPAYSVAVGSPARVVKSRTPGSAVRDELAGTTEVG